jgi:hypothetical protein
VLFDRAAGKLRMREATPLHEQPGFGQVGTDLGIKAAPQDPTTLYCALRWQTNKKLTSY